MFLNYLRYDIFTLRFHRNMPAPHVCNSVAHGTSTYYGRTACGNRFKKNQIRFSSSHNRYRAAYDAWLIRILDVLTDLETPESVAWIAKIVAITIIVEILRRNVIMVAAGIWALGRPWIDCEHGGGGKRETSGPLLYHPPVIEGWSARRREGVRNARALGGVRRFESMSCGWTR